ncbi:hypothetical protein [Steroidobacter cummioxidans]|uniref:hypothetical protein n=1 Tax=Steroidobacter cummioxidans TaxID=1803913 RepID=UPI000E31BFCB|nr:hypothetical protein [Steroidobacter cummioxidans]
MQVGMPWRYLGEIRDTVEGRCITLTNGGAALLIPVLLIFMAALAFANRSVVPLSLTLVIPLLLIKSTWYVWYDRLVVEHQSTLFGLLLTKREYPLRRGDSASIELIEDSMLLVARPRWHRLTLWSTALCHSRTVIRSNQYEELERAAALFNEAIGKALSHRSPPNHALQATCEDARA